MQTSPVFIDRQDDIAIVVLNAPERRNALSTAMRIALREHLTALLEDDAVRAIVLTGAAGNFCAGGDISEMAPPGEDMDLVRAGRRVQILYDAIRMITAGPKPVVAAVEGFAFGAGMSFAVACDYIVAADDARFAAAFGRIGLMGDCGLLWTLPQRIGMTAARDLLLTARTVDAVQAREMGMVDEVVPAAQVREAAIAKARQYLAVAPRAIAATKATLARGPSSLEELLAVEADVQLTLSASHDHTEARRAFLEKRPAVFKGR